MELQKWINDNIKDIADKLPTLVHSDPASFACGYNLGKKHILLELDRILEGDNDDMSLL